MPAQHHAQDVMRAIESDRWAVATNTGYSGIIDPTQNRVAISRLNTYEHKATIYRQQTQTLYVQDWLTPLLVLGTIAWWINAGINKQWWYL